MHTTTTITDIVAANPVFFSRFNMDAFNSKVYDDVREVPDGVLFITSEKFESILTNSVFPRMYTLRIMAQGTIESVSDFQEYSSLAQARRAMWNYK